MEFPFDLTFLVANPVYLIAGGTLFFLVSFFVIKNIKKRVVDANNNNQSAEENTSFLANYQESTEDSRFEEAKILANYGKFDKAVVILTSLIKTQPELEAAYFELFLIYFHQENEQASIELLNKLPFPKNSPTYQNFLANVKMEFPESLQPMDSSQPEENTQQLESPEETDNFNNKIQTKAEKLSDKNIHHQKTKTPITKQKIPSTKILQFDPEVEIKNLDQLELLVFKSFKSKAVVENKFFKYLDRHEELWQQLKANKPIYHNLIAIQENNLDTGSGALDSESLVYNDAKQFMDNQQYSQASELLEKKLLRHTDYEKLYPLLMENYLLGTDIEAYYHFRDAIFSHQQQPSFETILLLSDTETQILEKLEMVA